MTNFTYGDFCYLVDGKTTCVLGGNPTEDGNAAVNGTRFVGYAVIPGKVVSDGKEFTVHKIGMNAFKKCTKMTGIKLPNTIVELGYDEFFLTRIKTFFVPNSVEIIGSSAFAAMLVLRTITFQDGSRLKIIRNGGIASIPNLKTIIIPSSVTLIENSAFFNDQSLECVIICGSTDFSNISNPFRDVNHEVKVYVTSEYPKPTFGGIPVVVLNNECFISFPTTVSLTCRPNSTFRFHPRLCFVILVSY